MKLFLPILLVILVCSQCNGLRILGLFPLNGKSHWVMGEKLMTSLAERGHQVDVVTHFPTKNPPPNYRDISVEGSLPPVVNNMNASVVKRVGSHDVRYMAYLCGFQICDLLGHPNLQELIQNRPKYDLIIVELFIAPCYLAFGRHLNAPMVGVMTTSFHEWLSDVMGNPHNPSFIPGLFSPFNQQMTFWERLMNTFVTSLISAKFNYYMGHQEVFLKKYFDMDASIFDLYKDVAAILVNSHHSLNGIRPMSTGAIEVGGLHVHEDSEPLSPEVQKWLDDSKHGCIYFTLGSMVRFETFPKSDIEGFYKAFEKIAPVRVLMKIAKKEDLPPGLPKNVMTQSWYPQVTVFKHKNIKAFITHGGLMSLQEATYFGIPIVGIPLFGDQSRNMQIAANKKVGINLGSLENVTEESLGAALHTILHDKTYSTNMKKLSELFRDRPMKAIDTAIYWSEYVARHGYVLQSPLIHLNWWQQNLLDVYGFVFACLAIVLYVITVGLRKIINYKSQSKKNKLSKKNR